VDHVCGDMFENVPKGDAIFMKVTVYVGGGFGSTGDDGCI